MEYNKVVKGTVKRLKKTSNHSIERGGNWVYTNLLAEMARNHITGLKLAKILNVTYQSVYNKLNGKTDFTLAQMEAIQAYFKSVDTTRKSVYTLDYLFRTKEVV